MTRSNGAGRAWPAYGAASDTLLDISASGAAPLRGRTRERLDLLEAAWSAAASRR
ncbi:MAG: hypothetical protein JWM33_936 [Caulobacteraceae bacterium]|nr:hypothetical protein [Caulobacteraceae bacterium]